MYIRKKNDTVLHVTQNDDLLLFIMAKSGATKTTVKQWLSHRRVYVNGSVVTRHDTPLNVGDSVSVKNSRGNAELKHPKLRLVYEDDYLLVVEKKEGLLTVPSHPQSQETTVMSILRAYVKRQHPKNNVYVVHRLDRETSGLLVVAKSPDLQEYMRTYWKQLVTERTYVAVAEGHFDEPSGEIRSWFTEDKRNAMVYSSPVDDGGDLAVTHYNVLREKNEENQPTYSLVELHLETGRTNQIRVHLASKGHPVMGDRKYGHGNEWSPTDRLCLHARVLEFIHPATEKKQRFDTPIPSSFKRLF